MDPLPPPRTLEQIAQWLTEADSDRRTGRARKTRPVDARPARAGEVVVTVIAGEGAETGNTARAGDWVVRNRCPATGNEQYIVRADAFPGKYARTELPPDADGWQEFRPLGREMRFAYVRREDGVFSFIAPWGAAMTARPGDVIVRDAARPDDVYRVSRASFDCTYEVIDPPARGGDGR